jgi:hypothetical protein
VGFWGLLESARKIFVMALMDISNGSFNIIVL